MDRTVIRLDPGGPVDLEGLGASFAALARFYGRHFHGPSDDEDSKPRLFITRLESGSVIAEVVPYIMIFGQAVQFADQAMVVADFTRRAGDAIRAFAGEARPDTRLPDKDDRRDIREFMRPLVGRKGSSLDIAYARYERRDGPKETLIEYRFDEAAISRAALTIDAELVAPEPATIDHASTKSISEAMLFFEQASRSAGKSSGRTGDKATIPAISPKPLPVYFQKDADLKDQMVKGHSNPLTDTTFIVDVDVQMIDGEPKGYMVTHVHRVISSD